MYRMIQGLVFIAIIRDPNPDKMVSPGYWRVKKIQSNRIVLNLSWIREDLLIEETRTGVIAVRLRSQLSQKNMEVS